VSAHIRRVHFKEKRKPNNSKEPDSIANKTNAGRISEVYEEDYQNEIIDETFEMVEEELVES
jgi:hypothetical protein